MRPLHGVSTITSDSLDNLKRLSLVFDTIYALPMQTDESGSYLSADRDYLESKGFIKSVPAEKIAQAVEVITPRLALIDGSVDLVRNFASSGLTNDGLSLALTALAVGGRELMKPLKRQMVEDFTIRTVATTYRDELSADVVPICNSLLSRLALAGKTDTSGIQPLLRIAIEAFPVPSASCSWDDILAFKDEMRQKQWDFRRFVHALATKQQSEAEVRDEIEYKLNEYTEAMKLHNLKASQSFVDVFVITPMEILENIVKFNWSKIAKGALQVSKRKVELMEAEMKAPGRECAYVFDARKRFGPHA
jgi:hypothetical protein